MDVREADLSVLLAADLDRHFQQVVLHYQHRLYAFALRQTGSSQDAEDIVQEAFMQAYYALASYSQQRVQTLKLQPWLYKITHNIFVSRMRRVKLQHVSLDDTDGSIRAVLEDDMSSQPDMVLEGRESLRELESLVVTLPEQYREAVNLYYFEELSYREIAELLNQPMGTVKSNLHRGTKLLRGALMMQRSKAR